MISIARQVKMDEFQSERETNLENQIIIRLHSLHRPIKQFILLKRKEVSGVTGDGYGIIKFSLLQKLCAEMGTMASMLQY